MSKKIAVVRRLPPAVVDTLSPHGEVLMPATDAGLDKKGLIELMSDADAALVTPLDKIDAEIIGACPSLKVIASIGVGTDHIDLSAAWSRGITVSNTPGTMDDAVAELAIGLLLATARRLPQADAFVRGGKWTPDNLTGFGVGLDVTHKTLGIVGFGRIGQTLAKRVRGFEMEVLYHARHPVDAGVERELGARYVALPELLSQADFLVLLVPYSGDTHHLIGAPQLAQMKTGAVLINVARGGIVDDAALVAALKDGRLAGAALDCVENEPNLHAELLTLPNVVLSPHIGSATPRTRQAMVALALRNLIMDMNGHASPHRLLPSTTD